MTPCVTANVKPVCSEFVVTILNNEEQLRDILLLKKLLQINWKQLCFFKDSKKCLECDSGATNI